MFQAGVTEVWLVSQAVARTLGVSADRAVSRDRFNLCIIPRHVSCAIFQHRVDGGYTRL